LTSIIFLFLTQTLTQHLLKHESLRSNNRFCQRIWYVECYSVHAYMEWSHKFRLTPESFFNFRSRSLCGHFLKVKTWVITVGSMTVAGVGFSNLKNCRIRVQKFWNRSGDSKSDSGHLWYCFKLLSVAGTISCKRSWYCECAVQMFQRPFWTEQWCGLVIFVESESSKYFSSWVLRWSSR